MTMKKISPTKSWKNVTTCQSSQKTISTTNSLPVICLCVITGLMTGLCSEQHNNQSEQDVKALPAKKTKAMKRKSIYTILWRAVLLCLMLWFISIAGTGTVIAVYIVFRAVCFLL